MKKTLLLTSVILLMGAKNADAQIVKLYKSGTLVTSYKSIDVDSVVFEIEHEYVDLGLPSGTLWAKTNVGANTETDYGLYFAWGETTGYTSNTSDGHSFSWKNYSLCDGTQTTISKYCTSSYFGTVDGITTLESSDDAATANWGSNWCMPTHAQMTELVSGTNCSWTTINNVSGYKFANKSDASKYIFLPAAGSCDDSGLCNSDGYYWSSSLDSNFTNCAWYLNFNSSFVYADISFSRFYGLSVRPVRVQK